MDWKHSAYHDNKSDICQKRLKQKLKKKKKTQKTFFILSKSTAEKEKEKYVVTKLFAFHANAIKRLSNNWYNIDIDSPN